MVENSQVFITMITDVNYLDHHYHFQKEVVKFPVDIKLTLKLN